MPHFSIVTKIFTTHATVNAYSVLQSPVDILGGIHREPENYGFHKQNLGYLDLKSNETINRAKINVSMSDINV